MNTGELIAELAAELRDTEPAGNEQTARTLVTFVQKTIGCSHVSLLLSERGRLEVVAASDPWVERLDRRQLESGDGPLPTAFTYDSLVLVRDAKADPRWPAWSDLVTNGGVLSALQIPLRTPDRIVGVLGLYGAEANAFSVEARATAGALAQYVAEISAQSLTR